MRWRLACFADNYLYRLAAVRPLIGSSARARRIACYPESLSVAEPKLHGEVLFALFEVAHDAVVSDDSPVPV